MATAVLLSPRWMASGYFVGGKQREMLHPLRGFSMTAEGKGKGEGNSNGNNDSNDDGDGKATATAGARAPRAGMFTYRHATRGVRGF